jgi:hypothetical protein
MTKSKNNSNAHYSAVMRHAEYAERQKSIDCPFGKAFKTGGHKTGRRDISRKRMKQNLNF